MATGDIALPRRVVAIRPGALGDTLLALPALAWLRRMRPGARICLVARADVLPLAVASGLAETASDFALPQWADLFAGTLPPSSLLGGMLAGSAAIAWLPDYEGTVARTLAAAGAAPVVIGAGRPAADAHTHAAVILARALGGFGIAPPNLAQLSDALPHLRSPHADVVYTDALWQPLGLGQATGPVVALHPGSGGAAKRWPAESFAALAALIRYAGGVPLLIEGPADAADVRAVLDTAPAKRDVWSVARDLMVGALAALLSRCAAYVGNDSGVSHLAGLLGVPTLALFGPTDPAVWAPLGPTVRVLRSPSADLSDLAAAEVWQALRVWLPSGCSGDESTRLPGLIDA